MRQEIGPKSFLLELAAAWTCAGPKKLIYGQRVGNAEGASATEQRVLMRIGLQSR